MQPFSLQSVLDHRSQTRDLVLAELARLLAQVSARQNELDQLKREQGTTGSMANASIARLAAASRARSELQRQIDDTMHLWRLANDCANDCRDRLAVAERKVAVLEQLRDRQADQQRAEEKRRLEKERLEQMTASFSRR
ncbi:MAG: hypothetical protein NXI22_09855 [bacterium]|nr:hypothetical protein [bacterium]